MELATRMNFLCKTRILLMLLVGVSGVVPCTNQHVPLQPGCSDQCQGARKENIQTYTTVYSDSPTLQQGPGASASLYRRVLPR